MRLTFAQACSLVEAAAAVVVNEDSLSFAQVNSECSSTVIEADWHDEEGKLLVKQFTKEHKYDLQSDGTMIIDDSISFVFLDKMDYLKLEKLLYVKH